jgi:hypothetical protein
MVAPDAGKLRAAGSTLINGVMGGHSRSKNGVASLAYSRSKNGVASLAYVSAIHDCKSARLQTWMPGTRPGIHAPALSPKRSDIIRG